MSCGAAEHMRKGVSPWGASAILLAAAAASGCHREGPPRHYKDPQAMIEVFEEPERDQWQQPERVIRALQIPSKNAIVADIGAGSGYFTRRLAAEVPEGKVYAVDVDTEFENYLERHRESWGAPNIEPRLAHYDDPMLPRGEIDLVFTSNTYSFIRDRVTYFRKVREVLRPEGRLAIVDFRPEAVVPAEIAPKPEHRVARETAVQELQSAGFQVEREETFLPHQWFLILRPGKS